MLRLRRGLPPAAGGRARLLEVEVEMPAIDPELLLAHCEDFLVTALTAARSASSSALNDPGQRASRRR
jgi:hypothetical protein